jgi:hypothetical protein
MRGWQASSWSLKMRQFLLALVLIAVPVGLFAAYKSFVPAPPPAAHESLGDLSAFTAIINDVQKISATGDFVAAEKRVTDFETAWDDQESTLRKRYPDAWGNIDSAADAAFKALRAGSPKADDVHKTLQNLQTSLASSGAADVGAKAGSTTLVHGVAVTDASGHPIPCEDMIKQLKSAAAGPGLSDSVKTQADGFLAKALERCNADDDARADEFSAQGLALTAK